MSQKVHLTLTGCQRDETGEATVTKYCGDAEYFEKYDSIYLLYEETPEGDDTVVRNTMKLKPPVLELTRRGGISSRMIFEPDKEYPADYATPYGRLKIGISTHSLDICREDGLLKIKITYSLSSDGMPVSDCSLDITARFSQ